MSSFPDPPNPEFEALYAESFKNPTNALRNILNNPYGKNIFRTFLMRQSAQEHLLFYDAINEFKSLPLGSNAEKAREIFQQYVASTGLFCVELDHTQVQAIEQKIKESSEKSLPSDIFDQYQDQTFSLLRDSAFVRFAKSREYKNWLINPILPPLWPTPQPQEEMVPLPFEDEQQSESSEISYSTSSDDDEVDPNTFQNNCKQQ